MTEHQCTARIYGDKYQLLTLACPTEELARWQFIQYLEAQGIEEPARFHMTFERVEIND